MMILLYVMDSLRPDFLGCYGDRGAVTPHLDRLAAGSTRYEAAYTVAPWSKPAAAALLTGWLPRALGMRELLTPLPAGVPTLAERLGASGLPSLAITANPFVSTDFGLLRGFDPVVEGFRPGVLAGERERFHPNQFRRLEGALSAPPAALVLARSAALHGALLARLPADGNALALLWSMDSHAPFFLRGPHAYLGDPRPLRIPAADPEWLRDGVTLADLKRLYREMIAYNDARFGELRAALEARALWDDALVILCGDHGEGFGEHGVLGHTHGLWEEQIRVPLLVKRPGQRDGEVVAHPVSLLDVAATILERVGAPAPPDGQSLGRTPRPLLIEDRHGWALRDGPFKALAPRDGADPLLFHLARDPGERHPLDDTARRVRMAAAADALRAGADTRAAALAARPAVTDPAVLRRLRDLGYL